MLDTKRKRFIYAALLCIAVFGAALNEYYDRKRETEFFERVETHHGEAMLIYNDVASFMHKGARFTAADGAKLEARIEQMEKEHRKHLDHSAIYSKYIDEILVRTNEINAHCCPADFPDQLRSDRE